MVGGAGLDGWFTAGISAPWRSSGACFQSNEGSPSFGLKMHPFGRAGAEHHEHQWFLFWGRWRKETVQLRDRRFELCLDKQSLNPFYDVGTESTGMHATLAENTAIYLGPVTVL